MIFNIMGGKEGWHVKDLLRAAQSLGFKAHVTDFRLISHSLAQPSKQAFEEADCTIIRTMPPGSLEQVVFRMDVLHALQRQGKRVLNPPRALESAVDKFLASELLQSHMGNMICFHRFVLLHKCLTFRQHKREYCFR
ncbi:MAG: hypothetical protein EBT02_17645, partial [Planctomycetia bacterium]|nr:hypothetical protein [Planctomycetia bacterium]